MDKSTINISEISGTYFINKHYIKIITQAIGSYWTSAIKESEENQCLSGLTASNPSGLITKGMVKNHSLFSFCA